MAETNLTALVVLHYVTSISILTSYASAKVAASCLLHKPPVQNESTPRRIVALSLLLVVLATVLAQGLTLFAEQLSCPDSEISRDSIVYTVVSLFGYALLAAGLAENAIPLWYPFVSTVLVAVLLETPTTVLQILTVSPGDDFSTAGAVLQRLKLLSLIAFIITSGWFALRDRQRAPDLQPESEPLLNEVNGDIGANGDASGDANAAKPDCDDGNDDSDSEGDPQEDAELKKTQKKRLEDSGSLFNYLRSFRLFIPILSPAGKPLVQACFLVTGLVLIGGRFLNVLLPRQLGIITEELTQTAGTVRFPAKAIAVYAIYYWLGSGAGLPTLRKLAHLPILVFTRKSIGMTSFTHLMNLSMDFHNDKNSGELLRAISQGHDLERLLDYAVFEVMPTFVDLIVAFFYVYSLFGIDMSLILGSVSVSYVWFSLKMNEWNMVRRRKFNRAWQAEGKVLSESISNWQTVSQFNRVPYECKRYANFVDDVNSADVSVDLFYSLCNAIQTGFLVVGRLAAICLGAYQVAQGVAPLGDFVTLALYWASIERPLGSLTWGVRATTRLLTDAERMLQLLETQPSVRAMPEATELQCEDGHVEFDGVDFSYDPRKQILKKITFMAKPGQTIALVGETGGGKSTIIKILYRYHDVNDGTIRIDGQDIKTVTQDSLREIFGMVPQDAALFNISIMENIRYARLEATDEEVKDACRDAAIHDKIESFPDGYQSKFGERGVKLSGGELQRVTIARAMLRRPKIVPLDEATSMIDAETEGIIQQALRRLTAGRTTFIIAHRLSTIQHADVIFVIHDGEIVESGTHEDLFRKNGRYTLLWSKQMSKEIKKKETTLDVSPEDEVLVDLGEDGGNGANTSAPSG